MTGVGEQMVLESLIFRGNYKRADELSSASHGSTDIWEKKYSTSLLHIPPTT